MPQAPPVKRYPYAQWSPDARALDLVGDKWTLLIVRDLAAGPQRFVDLQRVLPGISSEQLRARVNRMVADGLLTRKRYREVPPRVDYELTAGSRELLRVIGALARWGYDWAWTAPREGEAINVGAILRLAPGLLELPETVGGRAEFVVDEDAATTSCYTLAVHAGAVTICAHTDERPDVRVRGAQSDWIAAFGPAADFGGLEIEGDRRLAGMLLDGIAASRSAPRAGVESLRALQTS